MTAICMSRIANGLVGTIQIIASFLFISIFINGFAHAASPNCYPAVSTGCSANNNLGLTLDNAVGIYEATSFTTNATLNSKTCVRGVTFTNIDGRCLDQGYFAIYKSTTNGVSPTSLLGTLYPSYSALTATLSCLATGESIALSPSTNYWVVWRSPYYGCGLRYCPTADLVAMDASNASVSINTRRVNSTTAKSGSWQQADAKSAMMMQVQVCTCEETSSETPAPSPSFPPPAPYAAGQPLLLTAVSDNYTQAWEGIDCQSSIASSRIFVPGNDDDEPISVSSVVLTMANVAGEGLVYVYNDAGDAVNGYQQGSLLTTLASGAYMQPGVDNLGYIVSGGRLRFQRNRGYWIGVQYSVCQWKSANVSDPFWFPSLNSPMSYLYVSGQQLVSKDNQVTVHSAPGLYMIAAPQVGPPGEENNDTAIYGFNALAQYFFDFSSFTSQVNGDKVDTAFAFQIPLPSNRSFLYQATQGYEQAGNTSLDGFTFQSVNNSITGVGMDTYGIDLQTTVTIVAIINPWSQYNVTLPDYTTRVLPANALKACFIVNAPNGFRPLLANPDAPSNWAFCVTSQLSLGIYSTKYTTTVKGNLVAYTFHRAASNLSVTITTDCVADGVRQPVTYWISSLYSGEYLSVCFAFQFPLFNYSLFYDPDLSILYPSNSDGGDGTDGGGSHSSDSSGDNTLLAKIIVPVVCGVVLIGCCAVIVVSMVVLFFWRRHQRAAVRSSVHFDNSPVDL